VDVVTAERQLVAMRWGLVPWWWNKPLKELRMATFNARAETVETKPVFRDAFERSRCLIPGGRQKQRDLPLALHNLSLNPPCYSADRMLERGSADRRTPQ